MNKYRKKPVEIEALKFSRNNWDEIKSFTNNIAHTLKIEKRINGTATCIIPTLEGFHVAKEGDWIIKGVKGEFYPCKPDIFEMTYDDVLQSELHHDENKPYPVKSLHNTTSNGARKNVKDIQFWGDGDLFKLLSKASSESEGWMKSTKAMEITGVGCVVQVTTQQRNPDGTYSISDAVTFVPNTCIISELDADEKVVSRELMALNRIPKQ